MRKRKGRHASVGRHASPSLDDAPHAFKQRANKHAVSVANAVNQHTEATNIDLRCTVSGVTHRGGFKLRFTGVESLTADWMDRMRQLCAQHGYRAQITFDTTTANAVLHACPTATTSGNVFASIFRLFGKSALQRAHPLTLCFLAMFFFNLTRHALTAVFRVD